jgi:hypothetical protein
VATQTDKIVTKWSLDAKTFNKGIRDLKRSMSDVQAGFQMATGAIGAFGKAMGEVLDRGAKFARLQDANTLSIDKARAATKGYVSDLELLKAANAAQAFDLGLSEQQFAKLTKAAVVMSQKLGTDANQAIGDLTLGLARQSRKILDNLGIMVSVTDANEAYAKAVGKSVQALTDAEKKTAFMNATMRELDRLTGDAGLSVKNAGDQFAVLKSQLDNSINSLSRAIIETRAFKELMESVAVTVGDVATAIKLMSGNIDIMDKEVTQSIRRLSTWVDIFRGGGGANIRRLADAIAEFREKTDPRFLTGKFAGERTRPRRGAKGAVTTKGGKRGKGIITADVAPEEEFRTGLVFAPDFQDDIDTATISLGTLEEQTASVKVTVDESALSFQAMGERMAEAAAEMNAFNIEAQNTQIAVGLANQLGAGFLDAAASAIEGTDSFGVAILKMLKSVTLGLSKQLLAHGINALIQAKASSFIPFAGPVLAAQWGTAAGIYFAGAATMGGLGLGLTAATAAATGGGGAGAARGSTSAAASAPVFTNRNRPQTQQPINVNVFLGDQSDPAAAAIASSQIAVAVQQAAA